MFRNLVLSSGFLLLWALPLVAQSTDALERNYKKKLESEFLTRIEWKHKLDEATSEAREKDLPIVGYFTRSWSP